jgi:hypothetical protein
MVNLQKDLDKLKEYIGKPEEFNKRLHILYADFPDAKNVITDYVEKELSSATSRVNDLIADIAIRSQLAENVEILPLAYIARQYFHKTKAWLYQRINGNNINGKPAKFTTEEVEIFNNALKDISKKIGSINISC